MPIKHLVAILLFFDLTVAGCSGPTTTEPEPLGPAAIISVDSVANWRGSTVTLAIRMEYPSGGREQLDTLGGLDLTIAFDSKALTFLSATQGEAISQWEYFTYRTRATGPCCDPSIVALQIVARRDLDDDVPVVPPQGFPDGAIALLSFWISAGDSYIDTTTDVRFFTGTCGDNTFSPQHDQRTYYTANPVFGYDSGDAAFDSMGCARIVTIHAVLAFSGGGVKVAIPPPIRGDIDLDGTPFNITDLTHFMELYFNYGPEPGSDLYQTMFLRTDCNNDGQYLTIADFDYFSNAAFRNWDTSAVLPPPYGDSVRFDLRPDGADWSIEGTSDVDVNGFDLKILDPSNATLGAEWMGDGRISFSAGHVGDTLRIVAINGLDFDAPPALARGADPPIRITSDSEVHPVIVSGQASMAPGVLMEVILEP